MKAKKIFFLNTFIRKWCRLFILELTLRTDNILSVKDRYGNLELDRNANKFQAADSKFL